MSETETTHGAPSTLTLGQIVLHPDRAGYRSLVADLRRDGFTVCLDVTAVDYPPTLVVRACPPTSCPSASR